jgi:hypothetical protein
MAAVAVRQRAAAAAGRDRFVTFHSRVRKPEPPFNALPVTRVRPSGTNIADSTAPVPD